jgi:hypothetical protein
MNFSDFAVSKRKIYMTCFDNINKIVDWHKIETIVKKYYNKGDSVDGRSAYEGILLFKITLLQKWSSKRKNKPRKFTKTSSKKF